MGEASNLPPLLGSTINGRNDKMNFPLRFKKQKRPPVSDIQIQKRKQEARRTLRKLHQKCCTPNHYQEAMHVLKKLHKKWSPDHYLVLRVSYFDTDSEAYFERHKDSISYSLAVSTRNKIKCKYGIFIFKKGVAPNEMMEFMEKNNPDFPQKVQIKGFHFFQA